MSDLDSTLAAVDDAISRCIVCGKPRRSSPSPYYCGEGCQRRWNEGRLPLPGWYEREPMTTNPLPASGIVALLRQVDERALAVRIEAARTLAAMGAELRRQMDGYGSGSSRSIR